MTELLLIILAIFLSGFFSCSEIAFASSNRLKLEIGSRKESPIGRIFSFFNQNPESYLTTSLAGNIFANVVFATLMTIFLMEPISNWLGTSSSNAAVLIILILISTAIIILFGEILPKALFRLHTDRWMKAIAIPQQVFYWLFKPLISVANATSNLVMRLLQFDSESSEQTFRRQNLKLLFQELRNTGGKDLDKEDSEMLHNVLELSDKRVKESMIPRTDIVAVEKKTGINETLKLFISSGFSKLPVYQESIDNIIGVIFAYDLFSNPQDLTEIMRPIKLVPSSQKSKNLLTEFRKSNISVAVVIDEYGGTAGMVTIEDLLEEVVGDIQDEYDTEDYFIKRLSENSYILSGGMEIEDVLEKYPEIELPDESSEFETIAGYIINELGRIPQVNEELLIDGHKIIISKATPSRIETIKLVVVD